MGERCAAQGDVKSLNEKYFICTSKKYLQVASTRLTNRHQRPNIELCRDEPAHRLIEEVTELETTVQQLENKVGADRAGDGTSRSFTVPREGRY